jgi:hypothetical protein
VWPGRRSDAIPSAKSTRRYVLLGSALAGWPPRRRPAAERPNTALLWRILRLQAGATATTIGHFMKEIGGAGRLLCARRAQARRPDRGLPCTL